MQQEQPPRLPPRPTVTMLAGWVLQHHPIPRAWVILRPFLFLLDNFTADYVGGRGGSQDITAQRCKHRIIDGYWMASPVHGMWRSAKMGGPTSDAIRGVIEYIVAGTEAGLRHCAGFQASRVFPAAPLSLAHGGLKRKRGGKRGSCQQPTQRVMPLPLWARSWSIWPVGSTGQSHRTNDCCPTSARPMTSSVLHTATAASVWYDDLLVDAIKVRRGRERGF